MRAFAWLLALGLIGRAAAAPGADHYRLTELPPTAVRPSGWLRQFLERQRDGMTGHPEVMGYPFDSCLWAGIIPQVSGYGTEWWRYEQTGYLVDGITRLGLVLGDPTLMARGKANVDYILDHADALGHLGPAGGKVSSEWPFAVVFRAIEAEYLATGDPRIPAALRKHYLELPLDRLVQGHRHIVNVEGMLKTYEWTGDTALVAKAEAAYAAYCASKDAELTMVQMENAEPQATHGVSYMELVKLPAILYAYTGKAAYLQAAVAGFEKLERDDMLVDGVPSSNEHLAGKDPLLSHETCDISDFTWSAGYMLMATGKSHYADLIEKACFNAGPGAILKNFHGLQYFSSVNQFIVTSTSNQNPYRHGENRMAYSPVQDTECCSGNVSRLMPNFAARMWMLGKTGELMACLYGPSTITIPARPEGAAYTVTESTDYPFSDRIDFHFSLATPARHSFKFRIPAWCTNASVAVNGRPQTWVADANGFVSLERSFRDGDTVTVILPMTIKANRWRESLSVERGPLVFSYAIPERVVVNRVQQPGFHGKRVDRPDYPVLDLFPAGKWNYALDLNEATASARVQVVQHAVSGYPFDPGQSPITLRVPVKTVIEWKLANQRYTPSLPTGYAVSGPDEAIELEPYGSTRLRITQFPEAAPAAQ